MNDDYDFDAIPHNQTSDFPDGVSEMSFETEAQMSAFLCGLHWADDIDVENSNPFERDNMIVVRVKVGDF